MTGSLTSAQLSSFNENGFLVINQLLDDDDLRPIKNEYCELLSHHARALYSAKQIPSEFEELEFGARFTQLLEYVPDLHIYLNISLPLSNSGKFEPENFQMHAGPAMFDLLRHSKILDVVESIIGPEIFSNPVQQMRMKPPVRDLHDEQMLHSNVGRTVWHQDMGALLPEADRTDMVTVWVALTEATERNGCLQSVLASHRGGPLAHCPDPTLPAELQIPDGLLEGKIKAALPVAQGGVILFHKFTAHSALPNRSKGLRWSADLRYSRTGQPTGRPAFPGFVARSRSNPASELHDPDQWARSWCDARDRILSGGYAGRMFEDSRWIDRTVC
jgi:phytanoyl-CoA hydroxylase